MPRPLARRRLVVKVRNLFQLLVREEPKVEKRRGKRWVYLAAGELNQGREGQSHPSELLVEGWIPTCSRYTHVGRTIVATIIVVVVTVVVVWVLRCVWGGRRIVPGRLIPEVAHFGGLFFVSCFFLLLSGRSNFAIFVVSWARVRLGELASRKFVDWRLGIRKRRSRLSSASSHLEFVDGGKSERWMLKVDSGQVKEYEENTLRRGYRKVRKEAEFLSLPR